MNTNKDEREKANNEKKDPRCLLTFHRTFILPAASWRRDSFNECSGGFVMCNECKRSIIVKLDNDLSATIVVAREGIQDPAAGDKIHVSCTIQLPVCGTGKSFLHKSLMFGERVRLFREPLLSTWGSLREGCRCKQKSLYGWNWVKLFDKAEARGKKELRKLRMALNIRRDALMDAEKQIHENDVF